MTRTALVTGATGLLGREVVKAFKSKGWNAIGTGFSRAKPPEILKVDLGIASEIEQVLDAVKPSAIIHCAAQRFPDKVDADPAAARALNVAATATLAQAANARQILLLYISTDYVFPGPPGAAPYDTTAVPAPTNLYGQTKLDGEHAVLAATAATALGVVLRVPVLYGPADSPADSAVNVLMDATRRATATGAPAGGVVMDDWAVRYPTHTADVGRVCADIADKFLAAAAAAAADDGAALRALEHVLHFSAEERMTKYEICGVFARILGRELGAGMVANKQGNEPGAKVQRPFDCHLSTRALRDMGIDVHAQDFGAWWAWQERAYRH